MNINEFDLAFVVDTTASMGGFIAAAQRQMVEILEAVAAAQGVDIRVAIIEYRDHPPQDNSFVARVYAFSSDFKIVQKSIDKLTPSGGGDEAEAVFDGLRVCSELPWREHARRVAMLIGDAPPHGTSGFSYSDHWPQGCPCGETEGTISAKLEGASIKLYSIPLTTYVERPFGLISHLTGGTLCGGSQGRQGDAVVIIKELLNEEFGQLDLDRKVHALWHESKGELNSDEMAKQLDISSGEVDEALGRLGARDLLRITEKV